jgi:hypothetical protein
MRLEHFPGYEMVTHVVSSEDKHGEVWVSSWVTRKGSAPPRNCKFHSTACKAVREAVKKANA